MNDLQKLKNEIHVLNEYNQVATLILEHVKEVSKQFIGKKIDTNKGLASKYAEAIRFDREKIKVKPIPGTKWAKLHIAFVYANLSNLQIKISLCFSDGSTGCTYEERTFYFGKMENSILVSINEDCKVSDTVLDFDTELAAIKNFKKLEKSAREAEDKINVSRDVYKYLDFDNE